jgi:triacylglycerol lipase
MCPGFTATQSSIAWIGRRMATHGFVVMTINTNSTLDQPPSRATQLMAALRYLTNSSNSTLCGAPHTAFATPSVFSDYRSTCPYQ